MYQRFQYRKYVWKVHRDKAFNIYFPAYVSDSLYKFILKETPNAIKRIEKETIKQLPQNLNIIIYPSVNQLYESNIGLYEPVKVTFPTFVAKATRIVLAFDGSYASLRSQLYEALARVEWESQMKNESVDNIAKPGSGKSNSSREADIPFWYKEGSIRYFAHGWTMAGEDEFKRSFEQNAFTSWQQVLNYEPRLAGNAFCYFIAQNYYRTAIAQTVFQLQKKKSFKRAIRLVTKQSLDSLFIQCFAYYTQRFKQPDRATFYATHKINIPHKKGIVHSVIINPAKNKIAYTLLAKGRRTVFIYDIEKLETRKVCVYNLPPWIDDHSADVYPLMVWHETAGQLFIAKPRKGKIEIKKYSEDAKCRQTIQLHAADGITYFQPLSDNKFLLSAYRNGQSDIVSYDQNLEKYTSYTDDGYDDASPQFTGNKNQMLFVSNRPKYSKPNMVVARHKGDTLWQGIYAIDGNDLKPVAVDSTRNIKWDKPVFLNDTQLLVTNTKYGSERNVLLNLKTGSSINLSGYKPFQYLKNTNEISQYTLDKDSIYIMQQPFDEWVKENRFSTSDTPSPWLIDYKATSAIRAKEDSGLNAIADTHYLTDEIFKSPKDTLTLKHGKVRKRQIRILDSNGIKPYVLQLHNAFFTAQVNNDFFINRYQPYFSNQGQFKFPDIGAMAKGGFADLFENHHFTIAYALPAGTDGSTFFVRYEHTEKNADWGLSYYRQVQTLKPDPKRNWVDENGQKYPDNAKVKTHSYNFFIKRPLSYNSYLRIENGIRHDRTVFLATDKYTLDFLPILSTWSITTLSYNVNKLRPTIPLLSKGFKVNSSIDVCKGLTQDKAVVLGATFNFMYHQPIYKFITLVTQFHAGYSDGNRFMLYNLGGEENNVMPKTDTSVHFSQSAPYAFQTLITPFRGYYQNSLYGNQYLLGNTDLYFPIFQTLFPIETPLPFINNIQLGLLIDIASANETWNSANVKNKWQWSYGFSVRSVLADYPLRLDIAWPGTFSKPAVVYFSLNLQ